MIAVFRFPARRITLAFALSAMFHAAVLWLPHLHLPHAKVNLPPLIARLELRPLPASKPTVKPEPISQINQPQASVSSKLPEITPDPLKEMEKSEPEKSAVTSIFPKHVYLSFDIFKGTDTIKSGEIHHQFDIDGGTYTLKSTRNNTGLSSLTKQDQLIQTSFGKLDKQGFQPRQFQETIRNKGEQTLQATFERDKNIVRFSPGSEAALPPDIQDSLSFLYQLSLYPKHTEMFSQSLSDGSHLDQVQIEIGITEEISTHMGKLRALHLRKIHVQGEGYFEIWLALEFRLLPVKLRQVDGSENTIEEVVISDIRSSDE